MQKKFALNLIAMSLIYIAKCYFPADIKQLIFQLLSYKHSFTIFLILYSLINEKDCLGFRFQTRTM